MIQSRSSIVELPHSLFYGLSSPPHLLHRKRAAVTAQVRRMLRLSESEERKAGRFRVCSPERRAVDSGGCLGLPRASRSFEDMVYPPLQLPELHGCKSSNHANDSKDQFVCLDFLHFKAEMSDLDTDDVPMPIVLIDQDVDPEATVVQVGFGDRLGALIDTTQALKDLGLNVVKGSVSTEGGVSQTKLHITIFGRKVEDPDMLARIRLTVINNLLKYHPVYMPLISTHLSCSALMVWVGECTRQLDGAHVEFLRGIANPLGIKASDRKDHFHRKNGC